MSFAETIAPFFGRCAIVGFYGVAATNIVQNWNPTVQAMTLKHVPVAPLVLLVVFLLIIISCISLFIGFHARHGAVTLFGVSIIAAVTMHDFWNLDTGPQHAAALALFARDVAICGGLLLLVGMGPGPIAFDNHRKRDA
jgi:putative oxidoreductase